MAKMKEVNVEIDLRTGEIEMETFGHIGKECEGVLDKLESALSAERLKQTNKPEKTRLVMNVQKSKQQIRKGM